MLPIIAVVLRKFGMLAMVMGIGLASAQIPERAFAASGTTSMWSFSMWCLEMEMLPAARCDQRRPEDVTAYQAYVSRTQHFEQEILEEERRQAEALERLNRQNPNPGARIP
jgi:hypothetical protein